MTSNLFLMLAVICCAVSGLLTEAIKKWCENCGKTACPNLIALIDALIVGCGGTIVAYVFMGVSFTAANIICIPLMGMAVWIGSMVGYDKVTQLIGEILGRKTKSDEIEQG